MSKKIQLILTRSSSQAAENFGWTIGGFALAYEISGDIGIIALISSMLVMANATTVRLRDSEYSLGPSLIRRALIWRGISFILMILADQYELLIILIMGGACSGIYVGSFWPSFYSIYKDDFKEWYSLEKTSAIILTLLSAFCLKYLGVFFVLSLSFIFVIISYISTLFIDHGQSSIMPGTGIIETQKSRKYFLPRSFPERLAFTEGALNSSTNLARYLVVLCGIISIHGLPEYISLGLILAISQFSGAIFSWLFSTNLRERGIVRVGLGICSFSTVLLFFESSWLLGIVAMTCGSSVIFPIFKDEVDRQLADMGMDGNCVRESSRNSGRVLGTILGAAFWFSIPSIIGSTIAIMLSLIALIYCLNNTNEAI